MKATGNGRASSDESQDQETRAGPALRECREEAPHKYPFLRVPERDPATKPDRASRSTLFRQHVALARSASSWIMPLLTPIIVSRPFISGICKSMSVMSG